MSRGAALRATVRLAARAKINLRLNVLAREAGGYHQVETVFCLLDFADDVEITLGGTALRFEVESPDHIAVPEGSDNLVYRAAEVFFEAARKPAHALIRLKKRIPVGAGLGGGSSDAATTLKGLNLLARSPLDEQQLLELGAALGADVPFFLCGSSLAFAWARGQRLMPLDPLPPMPTLLLIPPFAIETKAAYGMLAVTESSPAAVIRTNRFGSWDAVKEDAANDFEAALFPKHPDLERMKDALTEAGATVALLSGSGSTIFGLFPLDRAVTRAARKLREQFPQIRTIETHTIDWTTP